MWLFFGQIAEFFLDIFTVHFHFPDFVYVNQGSQTHHDQPGIAWVEIPGVQFNGLCEQPARSLYTVLNVSFPPTEDNEMLLFNLDISGISASGGSACSSGSSVGSHVLAALGCDPSRGSVRFSFSKFNTKEEIDYTVSKLAELFKVQA